MTIGPVGGHRGSKGSIEEEKKEQHPAQVTQAITVKERVALARGKKGEGEGHSRQRGKLRSLQSKEPTTVTTEEAEAIVKKQILTILLVSNIFFVANVRER